MSFWNKIKEGMRRFMSGRHGVDELSMALLVSGLILLLFNSVSWIFSFLYMALYIRCIYRIFSRNNEKRNAENMRYIQMRTRIKSEVSQFWARMKNMRKYKYFKCPACNARLRLPRKVGEVTVTCGKCHNAFKHKA